MKRILLIVALSIVSLCMNAQDTDEKKKEPVKKKGWSFGALPAIAYDSDMGFLYGALANIFHFGDGSRYPDYDHSLYIEWSRTTKGSGTSTISYDSQQLIKNTRLTAEVSYLTEKALDFYGFNGYSAHFNPNFSDEENTNEYVSRMFYRYERSHFRAKADFQINLKSDELRLLVGYTMNNFKIDNVDLDNLNEGKNESEKLPEIDGLYQHYIDKGIIKEEEKSGGINHIMKLGLVYDTRDRETNPQKGIWAEAFLLTDPGFSASGYGKIIFNWKQYFTIIPNRISAAYRISVQPKIWGTMPWYTMPFSYNSAKDRNALGGAKTIRGMLRNRVIGEGIAFANFELRTIPYRTVIFNQNFNIGIVPFIDLGMVIQDYDVDKTAILGLRLPDDTRIQPTIEKEGVHATYGAELKLVLNDNFIISVSYGVATDKRDGDNGLYIGLNYMF